MTAVTGAGLTFALRRVLKEGPVVGGVHMGSGHHTGKDTVATAAAAVTTTATTAAPPAPPPQADIKPAHDVVAGAMARAASQGTIHPLDTMKVRMQTGTPAQPPPAGRAAMTLRRGARELGGLYKGVVGAATGAGIIIGAYFAFYSTTKRFLREQAPHMGEGSTAFVAGATAALGSSVVKVPLAVCIRSVQAGVYRNVFHAAESIVGAAGVRGLFTGFVPTILEDVPDMAVKFAVYETLRKLHGKMNEGRPANIAEDLAMGGFAGAAAAAATTPLDVVKTIMMCSASSRPSITSAAKKIMSEGKGLGPFFRGVGPRALSNGLNSAIFFCFFEAIRQVLTNKQKALELAAEKSAAIPRKQMAADHRFETATVRPQGSPAACLTLALPAPGWKQ